MPSIHKGSYSGLMQKNEIHAIVDIALVFPYKKSIGILIQMLNTWQMIFISGGTTRRVAKVQIPQKTFKKLWGHNPRIGTHHVLEGTEDFIAGVEVVELLTL